ncbi:MAG TPA: class I SAM-dependent methyltransferase, partial [Terriglobales bacterium]|nr:class I SAM-dependent methyltransferase [Terriglobales bacterium]
MRTEVLNTARFDSVVNGAWHWLAARFRRKRRAMFLDFFPASSFPKVIDVGGIATDWRQEERVVTILNRDWQDCGRHRFMSGDARHIECAENTFDLAYCNSVIEHVGTWGDQKMLAAELRRIAPAVWVQTPNRWFPFEVHYLTFFLHW